MDDMLEHIQVAFLSAATTTEEIHAMARNSPALQV
jgi:hypothetical protein